jgi:hypothetical protein
MKISDFKSKLLIAFNFVLILALISIFLKSLVNGYSRESWQISEFLINYQGGFVRRGLLGELILILYKYLGIEPYTIIVFGSALAYLTLIVFFVIAFLKKGYPVFILPFVFFLGNPVINEFWVRKDILIVLIFLIVMYFALNKSKYYLILVNLFLIIGILIHESIAFFTFPILLLIVSNNTIFYQNKTTIKSILISASQLLPSFIAFLATLYHHGSQIVANKIWSSWNSIPFPQGNPAQIPYAIDGLTWTKERAITIMISTLKNFNDGIYAPLAWLLILSLIYFISTNTDKMNLERLSIKPLKMINKTNISNILIFQLLTVIPLFVMGWDYGRWVFFWITTSFAIIVLVPEKKLAVLFPSIIATLSSKINYIMDSFLSKSRGFLLLLCILIGVPVCSWNLFSCVNTNSFIIILRFISNMGS